MLTGNVRTVNFNTGEIEFVVDGMSYLVFAVQAIDYFNTPGCSCRPIFIPVPVPKILIGGQDDCPIHGFGE